MKRTGGRPAVGLDARICPRCFGHKVLRQHGEGKCRERLDKRGAAAIVGVSADTWSRMCREATPNARQKQQGPRPDYPAVLCADGRYRDLWKPETVRHYVANRPTRGVGGGRPRRDGSPARTWTDEQRRAYNAARDEGYGHAQAARIATEGRREHALGPYGPRREAESEES